MQRNTLSFDAYAAIAAQLYEDGCCLIAGELPKPGSFGETDYTAAVFPATQNIVALYSSSPLLSSDSPRESSSPSESSTTTTHIAITDIVTVVAAPSVSDYMSVDFSDVIVSLY